jgi:hypothetical protein
MASDFNLDRFCNEITALTKKKQPNKYKKKRGSSIHPLKPLQRRLLKEQLAKRIAKQEPRTKNPTKQMAFTQWAQKPDDFRPICRYPEAICRFGMYRLWGQVLHFGCFSSVSPSYLRIRHAFWDLVCLHDFDPEISPRHFPKSLFLFWLALVNLQNLVY